MTTQSTSLHAKLPHSRGALSASQQQNVLLRRPFRGVRAALVAAHLPEYLRLEGASRSALDDFWDRFFELYWKKIPWTLPLTKEPPSALADAMLSLPGEDSPIPPELVAQKIIITHETEKVRIPHFVPILDVTSPFIAAEGLHALPRLRHTSICSDSVVCAVGSMRNIV